MLLKSFTLSFCWQKQTKKRTSCWIFWRVLAPGKQPIDRSHLKPADFFTYSFGDLFKVSLSLLDLPLQLKHKKTNKLNNQAPFTKTPPATLKNTLEDILNDKDTHNGDFTDNWVKPLDEIDKILSVKKWPLTSLHLKMTSPKHFTPNQIYIVLVGVTDSHWSTAAGNNYMSLLYWWNWAVYIEHNAQTLGCEWTPCSTRWSRMSHEKVCLGFQINSSCWCAHSRYSAIRQRIRNETKEGRFYWARRSGTMQRSKGNGCEAGRQTGGHRVRTDGAGPTSSISWLQEGMAGENATEF